VLKAWHEMKLSCVPVSRVSLNPMLNEQCCGLTDVRRLRDDHIFCNKEQETRRRVVHVAVKMLVAATHLLALQRSVLATYS
jgi:hypothetical protein